VRLRTRILGLGGALALTSSLGLGLLLLSLQRDRDVRDMELRARAFLEAVQVGVLPMMAEQRVTDLDRLVSEIREHRLEDLDLVFLAVLDPERRVLGHTDPLLFGTLLDDDSARRFSEEDQGRVEQVHDEDREILVVSLPVVSRVPGYPGIRWGTLVAGFDLTGARKAWTKAVIGTVALILVAALAAAGLAVLLLDGQVVRPVQRLTEVAAQLGSGNLSARVPLSGRDDDLAVLGRTFNQMAEALEQHTHGLEKQVRQRTRELERANRQLQEANERLQRLAVTDGLTGLYNFRYLRQTLEMELHRASRQKSPLSLLMLDVDLFKQFNDRYGHPAGDRVLQRIAWILQKRLRVTDIPCRYGGEEFAVVLPDTDSPAAIQVAEEIRRRVEGEDFSEGTGVDHATLTISIGVASFPGHGKDPETLLKAADTALYRAKDSGRNRVVLASPLEEATS